MCRLFALAALEAVNVMEWLKALKWAAERDPLLEKLTGSPQHGDGWGLAALSADRLIHYRSPVPIWADPLLEVVASTLSFPVAVVAHARKASAGMPLGAAAAHPFAVPLRDGSVLFVSQNGALDVERLLKAVGPVASPDNVDSFIYSLALARYVEGKGDLGAALAELHSDLEGAGCVKGMANTAALLVRRSGGELRAEVGAVRHVVSDRLRAYGELYVVEGERFVAAFSSTLARTLPTDVWGEPLGENVALCAELGASRFRRYEIPAKR